VAADIATYFGVLKSRVTVNITCMDHSSGTIITSNMEFPSQAQSDAVKALFNPTRRRSSVQDLSLYSLDMLQASAKNDPLARMQTQTSTVGTGEVFAAVATLYVPPTKSASTFCEDALAVSACSSENSSSIAIVSDQCFEATGLYALELSGCSSVQYKTDVTIDCKNALGGSSSGATCFGATPVYEDIGGIHTQLPKDGEMISIASCIETRKWPDFILLDSQGPGLVFTGGLGKMMIIDVMEVWVCLPGHVCLEDVAKIANNNTHDKYAGLPDWAQDYTAVPTGGDSMCYVYHEQHEIFLPWGPNSILGLHKFK